MRFLSLVLLAAGVVLPVRASAQAAPADSTDSARVRLAPVTIIATRQTTSIFSTPLAVTVVGRPQLENKRGYSLDEALSSVPGVFAQSRYGASDIRLTIRGFGARGAGDRSNAGTSRGIRVLIDGIPETEPDGRTSFDMVDLAAANRIEVVRSNASALWGNAGGGVINISTVPEFHGSFATAQQMAGSYGFLRTSLQGGTHLGPAALALTFTNTMQEGYRAHSDSRRALVNVSMTSPLGESTDFGLFISAANDLFHIPGPLTLAEVNSDPRGANATYAARDERRYNRVGRIGVSLRHALSEASSLSGMLFVNPKVLQRSERGTFRDFNRYHLGGNAIYRAGYEIQPGISASTVAGADRAYQNGTILFYSLTSDGKRGTELRDNKGEAAMNTGVFLQQSFLFGDRLGADIGARWDQIRYDYRSFMDPRLNDAKDFARISPKVGVNFRVTPAHSFYANVGGGVEAPAGNETDPASTFGQDTVTAINPLLDPIRSTSYEVGTRHMLPLSGGSISAVSYDIALYQIDVANEIVPYRGGRFYFTAGKVRRRGAELGASVLGGSDLELTGSVTMSQNRYIHYTVDSVHYGRPGRSADYADNDVAGIPGLFYNLTAGRSVSENIPLRLQVSMRGVGDYFVDDANMVAVPGYRTFGATVSTASGISFGNLSLKAFLAVENLTDQRYIGSAFVNPDIVNGVPVAFEPGAGRSFIVSVSIGPRSR
ncbi:MAG: TonB-dependent receptor [Gemmatimonadaceae bacterium]|nr:TonB-dependent receptor [Gemmatimonadaceae bacterium]